MLRYAAFLPRGDTFRFADDYEKTRVVYVTSAGNMVPRAAFGLIRVTSVDPVVADRHIKSFLYTVFFVDQNREDALLTLQGGDAGRALDIMKEVSDTTIYCSTYSVSCCLSHA